MGFLLIAAICICWVRTVFSHRAGSGHSSSRVQSRRRPEPRVVVESVNESAASSARRASWGWTPALAQIFAMLWLAYWRLRVSACSMVSGPSPMPMKGFRALQRPRPAPAAHRGPRHSGDCRDGRGYSSSRYFSRAPISTSSRNPASTGARLRPTPPQSFHWTRGTGAARARLATMTTLRPMSDSGV